MNLLRFTLELFTFQLQINHMIWSTDFFVAIVAEKEEKLGDQLFPVDNFRKLSNHFYFIGTQWKVGWKINKL